MSLLIEDLALRYRDGKGQGRQVIDRLSVSLPQGQIISIVGPSGIGKSSLLLALADLQGFRESDLSFSELKIADRSPSEIRSSRRLSFVFQKPQFFEWLTVAQSIKTHCRISRTNFDERFVRNLAREYRCEANLNQYPSQMSGGQLSRAALVRALATAPNYLFLDEPFSGLDDGLRTVIGEQLFAHIRERKILTLLVTHQIEDAVRLSDFVVSLCSMPVRTVSVVDVGSELSDDERFHESESVNKFVASIRQQFVELARSSHD